MYSLIQFQGYSHRKYYQHNNSGARGICSSYTLQNKYPTDTPYKVPCKWTSSLRLPVSSAMPLFLLFCFMSLSDDTKFK